MEVVHTVVHTFRVFAQRTRADYLGPDSVVVDVCLHAMEEGILSAIATERDLIFFVGVLYPDNRPIGPYVCFVATPPAPLKFTMDIANPFTLYIAAVC